MTGLHASKNKPFFSHMKTLGESTSVSPDASCIRSLYTVVAVTVFFHWSGWNIPQLCIVLEILVKWNWNSNSGTLGVMYLFQGVTFRVENNDLVIARILHGGMIDRQGLLHVGDIIKEVNGHEVGNNPKELQELLKNISGSVTLKILPSYRDTVIPQQVSSIFLMILWRELQLGTSLCKIL